MFIHPLSHCMIFADLKWQHSFTGRCPVRVWIIQAHLSITNTGSPQGRMEYFPENCIYSLFSDPCFFLVPLGLKSQPDYKQYHQVLKLSKGFALWTLTKTLQYPAEILNFSMSYCRWTLVKRSSSSTEVGFKLAVHPVEKCVYSWCHS